MIPGRRQLLDRRMDEWEEEIRQGKADPDDGLPADIEGLLEEAKVEQAKELEEIFGKGGK